MNKFDKFVNFVSCLCILWNFCQSTANDLQIVELPSSDTCLSCICNLVSNCNRTIGCSEDTCGMFQIDSLYWINSGEHTVDGIKSSGLGYKSDFVKCANDEACAKKTVIEYLTHYTEDCNGDGIIDCEDHAAAHLYYNRKSCRYNLPEDFLLPFRECVSQLSDPTQKISPKSASEIVNEKCEEYTKFVRGPIRPKLECDKYTALSNYSDFDPKQLPFAATIGYGPINDIAWTSDGTLISDQYILTNANDPKKKATAKWVHFGGSDNDISIKDESTKLDIYEIEEYIPHPEYENIPKFTQNDLGLIKLKRKVEFSEFIRPVCLSTTPVDKAAFPKVITIGWTETAKSTRKNYLPVVVPILDFDECRTAYSGNKDYYPKGGMSSDKLTCIGNSAADRGACVEIGGTPLIHKKEDEPCMWVQIGTPSYGSFPCPMSSSLPFLYTNVHHYIDWIQSVVWPQ